MKEKPEPPVVEAPVRKKGLMSKIAAGARGLFRSIFWLKPQEYETPRPWFEIESLTTEVVPSKTLRILESYPVDQATVTIVDDAGRGRYLVSEPPLTQKERAVYRRLLVNIFYGREPSYEPSLKIKNPLEYVEGALWDSARSLGMLDKVKAAAPKYLYYLSKDAFGHGKIHIPKQDKHIEDISAVSYLVPVAVAHRKYSEYRWLETNIMFSSEDEFRAFNQRVSQRTGKTITTAVPIVDSTTADGDRVALTFGNEVTYPGSTLNIRKFPESPFSLAQLTDNGTLSPMMAAYLWETVELGGFLIVLGPPGAGKTTLVNAVLATIPLNQKIATIEDTLEIKLPHPYWLRFHPREGLFLAETRAEKTETRFEKTMMDLVKIAMRHSPNYVAVGEVRGEEIQALIHAASLGLGSVCSFHAYPPEAALLRMRTPPMNVSEGGLMSIWSFAQMAKIRMPDGKWARKLVSIEEIVPGKKQFLSQVFERAPKSNEFSPSKAKDVVDTSIRLRVAADVRGITNQELVRDLERKADMLKKMIKEKRTSLEDFIGEVAQAEARR